MSLDGEISANGIHLNALFLIIVEDIYITPSYHTEDSFKLNSLE